MSDFLSFVKNKFNGNNLTKEEYIKMLEKYQKEYLHIKNMVRANPAIEQAEKIVKSIPIEKSAWDSMTIKQKAKLIEIEEKSKQDINNLRFAEELEIYDVLQLKKIPEYRINVICPIFIEFVSGQNITICLEAGEYVDCYPQIPLTIMNLKKFTHFKLSLYLNNSSDRVKKVTLFNRDIFTNNKKIREIVSKISETWFEGENQRDPHAKNIEIEVLNELYLYFKNYNDYNNENLEYI